MKQKLTSRKLWVAIAGIIAGIVLIINGNTVEGTASIVSSVLGYLIAEGFIDAKAVDGVLDEIEIPKEDNVTEEKTEE